MRDWCKYRGPVVLSIVITLSSPAAFALVQGASDPPQSFVTRNAAVQAGCRFSALKGPATDTCVLEQSLQDPMHIVVYQRTSNGAYTSSNEMSFPSQYWDAKLSFADALGTGTEWLVVNTVGMHGTGIHQRILLIVAWDGSRFRTVAAESLGYECYRPTAAADYALAVDYTFATTNGKRSLQLKYVLTRDKERIGEWTDSLLWDAARFMLVPTTTKAVLSNSMIDKIREQVTRVRNYLLSHPLDPVKGSDKWIRDSGLMDVLNPVWGK